MALKTEGYKVTCFLEPISAYDYLSTNCVDLAILDVEMGALSGVGPVEKMLKNGVNTPVIFVSGNASLTEAAHRRYR